MGGLDGEDDGWSLGYLSEHGVGWGLKHVVYCIYVGHREMYHQLFMCQCALWRKGALLIKTPSLYSNILHLPLPRFSAKQNARSMHYAAYIDNNRHEEIQGHAPCCCCCCCCCGSCPGLGKIGTVSSCSNPPMVPWPACQPWPVCWFTKVD